MEAIKSINNRWLISGANGQLGVALTKRLNELGYYNWSFSRDQWDITNKEQTRKVIAKISPTVVVNAAAWTDVALAEQHPNKVFEVNAFGAEKLAHATKQIGASFVQISTDYVFSGDRALPWEIDSRKEPETVYGESKSLAESLVLDLNASNFYILRTSWLYGAAGKNFVKTILGKAINGERNLRVVNDQTGQPTQVDDLAARIIDLVELRIPGGIYHATNSGETTWFNFAREIYAEANLNPNLIEPCATADFQSSVRRPMYSVLSQKCWDATELPPLRSWKDGLKNSISNILEAVKKEANDNSSI